MTANATFMRQEIEEIPEAVARFLAGSRETLASAGDRLRRYEPRTVVTIARGSSDHAASFLKYAIELTAGVCPRIRPIRWWRTNAGRRLRA